MEAVGSVACEACRKTSKRDGRHEGLEGRWSLCDMHKCSGYLVAVLAGALDMCTART